MADQSKTHITHIVYQPFTRSELLSHWLLRILFELKCKSSTNRFQNKLNVHTVSNCVSWHDAGGISIILLISETKSDWMLKFNQFDDSIIAFTKLKLVKKTCCYRISISLIPVWRNTSASYLDFKWIPFSHWSGTWCSLFPSWIILSPRWQGTLIWRRLKMHLMRTYGWHAPTNPLYTESVK